ncbi:T9SS type A sorting domain-containing protein [Chryseobacterium oranimense]|uniref:T9SS type A sorting domain-containing protein n=1 Tax=Chryseobacterium oranimense TaxID=421058 RepID=UPI0031D1C4C2
MKYKLLFFTIFFYYSFQSQIISGSFDNNDVIYYENFGKPNDIYLLDNGKFLVFAKYNNSGVIYRLNANGTFDNDFGNNGKVFINESLFITNNVKFIAVQPDGKILYNHIGANNYATQNKFGRLNSDGSIDNSFSGSWFGINSVTYFNSPKLLPNGKIMATYYNGNGTGIVRYNSDGSLDTTFGLNGIYSISNTLYSFLNVFSNDYISISSSMGGTIGVYTNGIIGNSKNIDSNVIETLISNNYLYLIKNGKISRLNTNISLDTTFGNSGHATFYYFNIYGNTIANQSGDFSQLNLSSTEQKIILSSISNTGAYQGSYITLINNLGNLQDGKFVKANTNQIYYVLVSGSIADKCAFLKITNPTLETKDVKVSSKIKFYPNPAKEIIYFSDFVSNISLYDINGRVVFRSEKKLNSINLNFLEKGVYWLNGIDSNNIVYKEKLIIE